MLEVGDEVRRLGGEVAGFACIVDRSGGRFDPGAQYYCCTRMNIPIYAPEECPLCREGVPVVKPGSRRMDDKRRTG